ncbi:hypothetical protein FKP32DRAFT_1048759 [Trametes sanguinea]|nr:hypothetical protein FKP32DRAFT_1048759 [Trametes sanguinea]
MLDEHLIAWRSGGLERCQPRDKVELAWRARRSTDRTTWHASLTFRSWFFAFHWAGLCTCYAPPTCAREPGRKGDQLVNRRGPFGAQSVDLNP